MANYRGGRINEEVKREVSSIIHNNLRDPRITSMVSVTEVSVTKDLRYAKIYISLFGSESSNTETLSALKSSAGFIRKEIGRKINLRYTPEIIFEIDNAIERGMHIDSLLEKIKGNSDDTK